VPTRSRDLMRETHPCQMNDAVTPDREVFARCARRIEDRPEIRRKRGVRRTHAAPSRSSSSAVSSYQSSICAAVRIAPSREFASRRCASMVFDMMI